MKKKFTMLFAALLACAGVWAQDQVVGLKKLPNTCVDLAQGLETGYYLLKQVNDATDCAGGNGVGWIKASSEAASVSATSVGTGIPGEDGALYIWYVEVVDAGNRLIKISTANKVASWYLPENSQREKKLIAYANATTLQYHNGECYDLGQGANTPKTGSAFISNYPVTSYIHFSGNNLGTWTSSDTNSTYMVEFYAIPAEDLIVYSPVTIAKMELESYIAEVSAGLGSIALQTSDAKAAGYLSSCGSADGNVEMNMIDGNNGTFYGSPWASTVGSHHYWQVDLGDGVSLSSFVFSYITRANGSDTPTKINVLGSNDGEDFSNTIVTLTELPNAGGQTYTSASISNSYRYIRFEVPSTTNNYSAAGNAEQEVTIAIAEFKLFSLDESMWSEKDKAVKAAIVEAQAVLDDEDATVENVEAALRALKMATVEKPVYPFTITTDDANPVVYAIKSGRGDAYWYTYDAEDSKIALTQYTGANTQYWYFKEVFTADYVYALQLFPYSGEGKAMSYENTNNGAAKIVAQTPGTPGWTNLWLMATTDGKAPYGLQTYDKANYLSNNGGVSNKMGMWNATPSNDTGSAMYFVDPAVALQEVIDAAKAMLAGEGTAVGYYTSASIDNLEAAIATAESNLANKNFSLNELKAAIADVQVVLPEEGRFYQIVTGYKAFSETKAIYSTGEALEWKTLDAVDKAFYWSIAPNNDGSSFTFRNVKDNKYVNGTTMVEEDTVTTTLKSLAPGEFNIISNGNTWHANGHGSGAGASGNIINYGGGANGASSWMIVEVEHPDLAVAKATLQNKVDELKGKVAFAGTNPGNYKATETAQLTAPIAAAEEVLNGGSADPETYTEALAALNAAIATLDLEMIPVTEGLYRIVSAKFAEAKGITCYAKDEYYGQHHYSAWAPVNENDPLQYWTLEANGDGTFNIKAAYEGSYITTATSMSETAKAATFTALGNAQFNITLDGDASPLHCQGWNWLGVSQSGLTTYGGGVDSPSAWKLVAVTEEPEFTYELTVGEIGYASLMLAFNATIPAGVTCNTVVVEGDVAKLTAIEGNVLPAKTPVIITAEKEEYTFTSTDATATVGDNELSGTLYPQLIAANAYVLANKNGVGLYKAALNKENNTAFLNGANKAYLVVENSEAAMFSFGRGGEDEDATAIDQLLNANGELVIYDLSGRRVQKMEKGIYIVNGKKVVK